MAQRLHILGASGSGVSTLGRRVAEVVGWPHYDTDDFYWQPTDPPFRRKRPPDQRLERLLEAVLTSERWVLSGALDGWGDPLIARFDLVVFVSAPARVRLERLRARERSRFGARIEPGGDMHEHHERFLAWAGAYEQGSVLGGRSRARQEAWLSELGQPVLRLDGTREPAQLVADVLGAMLHARE